jgi:hypothetical protein
MSHKMLLRNRLTNWCGAFLSLILLVNLSIAQSGVSSITGTVKDAQGNVVARFGKRTVTPYPISMCVIT